MAMRQPGDILLVATYELGHQPLAVAWPAAFLERQGYAPAVMDVSVEPFDAEKARRARVVAISVPMHTALRLGVRVAEQVRPVNPASGRAKTRSVASNYAIHRKVRLACRLRLTRLELISPSSRFRSPAA